MTIWRNRIVDYGVKPASQFTANPRNPRRHPIAQQRAVNASLDRVGWVAPVIENARTGYLVDGHERVMQALSTDDPVPFVSLDLSAEEEAFVMLTLDPIAGLATYDNFVIAELLKEIGKLEGPLASMLKEIQDTTPLAGASDEFVGNINNNLIMFKRGNKSGWCTLNWGDIMVSLPTELYERALAYVNDPSHDSRRDAMIKILEAGLNICCP